MTFLALCGASLGFHLPRSLSLLNRCTKTTAILTKENIWWGEGLKFRDYVCYSIIITVGHGEQADVALES